ncbi:MAG: hypothetical protein ACLR4Z_10880 [Butyricicoccaceae bacterium]
MRPCCARDAAGARCIEGEGLHQTALDAQARRVEGAHPLGRVPAGRGGSGTIERPPRRAAAKCGVRVTGARPTALPQCLHAGRRATAAHGGACRGPGWMRRCRSATSENCASCMAVPAAGVHILGRHGVPFVLARLLPRTALLAGLAAFCAAAYLVGTRGCGRLAQTFRPRSARDAVGVSKLRFARRGTSATPLRGIDTPSIRRGR